MQLGDNLKAIQFFTEAMVVFEEIGAKGPLAGIQINLGHITTSQGELDAAIKYYSKGVAICEEIGEKNYMANGLMGLGNVYSHKEDYDQAIANYTRAKEIYEELGNLVGSIGINTSLSQCYEELGDYHQALDYAHKGLTLSEEVGDEYGMSHSLATLANIYGVLEDYPNAVSYGERAMTQAQKVGNPSNIQFASYALYTGYKGIGQKGKALDMLEVYQQISDSLYSEENQNATLRYEFQYQSMQDSLAFVQEQAETEVAYQKKLSQRNYFLFGGLGVALLGFLFYRYRQQKKIRDNPLP